MLALRASMAIKKWKWKCAAGLSQERLVYFISIIPKSFRIPCFPSPWLMNPRKT